MAVAEYVEQKKYSFSKQMDHICCSLHQPDLTFLGRYISEYGVRSATTDIRIYSVEASNMFSFEDLMMN